MNRPQHRKVSQGVPDVSFRIRENGDWRDLTSNEVFSNRTIVVFALPGAFTPTCSSSHLPGYAMLGADIRSAGVDDIYCLSVNDWYVMAAWRDALNVGEAVNMLPDGNADFTDAMGMLVDKRALGFGERSWRYSMVVRDNVIDELFVEDFDDPGDPFEVSGAQKMLDHLRAQGTSNQA